MSDPFATLGFVRSRLLRHSAEQPESAVPPFDAPEALLVLMAGDRVVLRGPTATLEAADGTHVAEKVTQRLFLGHLDGRPVFAACAPAEAAEAFDADEFRTLDLRSIATEGAVEAHELGLLAVAKSMLDWHGRSGFCANCGTPTLVRAGGFRRECPSCNAHHFPRTDPVVIMLTRRGEQCLLGRGPHFKPGMFSCLAGFLEPGETIEDAVRRECFEETRVRIGAVGYQTSQPWPFPSSLMIGCTAEGLDEAIVTDPTELEDARWFDREAVTRMLEHRHPEGIVAPPPMAIAHVLMRAFVEGRA
ncbi:NAD(+) diphosphatase [Methylobacterium trifolii]|uniref:NAD(+) diphosphatase n=1 Tax=Methylobacterium trifolii TaxID=1003092 RepID=A0ABQ4U630_9HYPH|nr:NAD(+) diphosphatase [Methylobacterium trifolii]GJE62389.1 NADH pyrophosphatase [Methylobacterium trifolii]